MYLILTFPCRSCFGQDGSIYTGVSASRNASYPLTNCGERTAIFKGGLRATGVFRIVDTDQIEKPISPCGACRQVMVEFTNKI